MNLAIKVVFIDYLRGFDQYSELMTEFLCLTNEKIHENTLMNFGLSNGCYILMDPIIDVNLTS